MFDIGFAELIIIAVVLPTILWADLRSVFVWIAVASTILFGAIGFADDYLKVARRKNLARKNNAINPTGFSIGLTICA